MVEFVADQSFWELFPDAKLGVVLLKDVQNQAESPEDVKQLLAESHELAKAYLTADNFSDNQVVQVYRKAYQHFKTKKGARSSIEALLKRVSNGQSIPSINPLVDIYNAASLRFGLPVGAEDSDSFIGDLRLTITDGGDDFYLIGDADNNPTLPNELCYKDDIGAVCRCLNWRDGERTMVTEHTQNAFLIIEALKFIEGSAKMYLHAITSVHVLDKDNPHVPLFTEN
ncbi:TPA: B3/4 domain-containing protein [Streptococcus pyogenes]|uniref:B3/B4 domain-containing protein n=1 Tax=Streptococcus pyogenes TaxID=1314 RepID=UPI00109D129E|nr:B3/4 domain-containing protein [Streptococcus pyogenes]QQA64759.1 B3/4 domain-containing protein [Streptococcus pyogenes]VHE83846.1 B3/4 domain-containing protein [Streptococcus pyogenes]VHF14171.1 B3/4 domain-containing protein [Streptococcus pyogenes]VHM43267.1 B3/4 domain-containing protein [Streptococcus pyogenes]HEQ4680417.1 B3/4 domain-containing protein [Streptococcus pyogenes]